MPSVDASVDGISNSLVFLRLVVEVVKEVEELLGQAGTGKDGGADLRRHRLVRDITIH